MPGGFVFVLLGATDYLASAYDYSGHLKLKKSTLLESIIYKLEYAFLPDKMNLGIAGWATIFLFIQSWALSLPLGYTGAS